MLGLFLPWRLHVGLDLGELLEAVEELHELGVLLAEGAVQLPVLVQQLVHDEVGEGQAVAGEPRPRAEKVLRDGRNAHGFPRQK